MAKHLLVAPAKFIPFHCLQKYLKWSCYPIQQLLAQVCYTTRHKWSSKNSHKISRRNIWCFVMSTLWFHPLTFNHLFCMWIWHQDGSFNASWFIFRKKNLWQDTQIKYGISIKLNTRKSAGIFIFVFVPISLPLHLFYVQRHFSFHLFCVLYVLCSM